MSYATEDVACPAEGSQAATLILALLMGHYPLKKVNPHKAPGPVGISGGVLRACAPPSSTPEAATGNQQFHVAPTPDPSSHWPTEGREPVNRFLSVQREEAEPLLYSHLPGSPYLDYFHQNILVMVGTTLSF